MRVTSIIASVSVAALMATACTTTDPNYGGSRRNNMGTGIIAGALGGALLGYLTNTNNPDEGRKNALIGAGVGALAGGAIGTYMDRQQRELEQQLSGSGVGVRRQGDNLVLVMPGDITFDTNQSAVKGQFYAVLDDVAGVFNNYDKSLVDIVGHADSDGADAYNLDLSRRRAEAVAVYLNQRGVNANRIYFEGRGESQPIASNATADGKAQNRRVEILIRPFTG